MKHTPGPWMVHDNIGRKSEIGVVADAAPCIIATMGNAKAWPKEARANAHLIAAAPELLAACKASSDMLDLARPASGPSLIQKKLRAAIAAAEGDDNSDGYHDAQPYTWLSQGNGLFVTISGPNETSAFLQGDDASNFLAQMEVSDEKTQQRIAEDHCTRDENGNTPTKAAEGDWYAKHRPARK